MHPHDPKEKAFLPEEGDEKPDSKKKSEQQRADPPLTEIKGVTDPEDYIEPEVEDEPPK